jgi:hypothetical protein
MDTKTTRFARTFAVFAALTVVALGFSGTAGAVDNDPPGGGDPPPTTVTRPNLTISSASVAAYGTSEWELRYTVTNRGTAATTGFRVDAQQNGSALLKSTAHLSLAAGASRSEVFRIPRTDCYLPVRFSADSTRVVAESSEFDNDRWAVGLVGLTCSTQPRYQVKAVSFHANDETGTDWLGSDEPYWIFNSVGVEGTSHTTASHVFGDIDTGDTAYFGSIEGCIYLHCSGGAAPLGMGIGIQLWENDLDYVNKTLADTAAEWQRIGGFQTGYNTPDQWLSKAIGKMGDLLAYINSWAADDLIGSQTYTYRPEYLAQRLPAIGGSFTDTRTYSGGGGEYTMTTMVSRVG